MADRDGRLPDRRRRAGRRLLRLGAAQAGRRGLDPARRARARAALRAPAALEGVPARRGRARGRLRQPARLVRGERRRAAARATNVMSLDPAGADGEAPGRGGGRLRQGADRHRARTSTSCASRAPSWRGSTTCARSATPTRSASEAADAEHVVLIGGSYIGGEVAASLTRRRGTRCTIVMIEDVALSRTFGEEVGRFFHDAARLARGRAARRRGAGGVRGRRRACSAVVTKSGRDGRGRHGRRRRRRAARTRCSPSAPASRSTTGSSATRGSRPRSPGIFAAGDVCSYDSVVHGRRLRVEHWDVALQQGRHAARAMLGDNGALPRGARTSSAISPTGRRSSTSARPTTGTRSSGAATATAASSAPGTWPRARSRRARGRPLRGPDPRPHADRDRRGRVGATRPRSRTPTAELESDRSARLARRAIGGLRAHSAARCALV